jgi:hypothetical protein
MKIKIKDMFPAVNRKQLLIVAVSVLLTGFLLSCEKDDIIENATTSIDTQYFDMDFTVQATDKSGFQIFAEETFSHDIDSLLLLIGLNSDQIEEVVLKEAIVSIKEGNSITNFNILGSIELTIYTDLLGEMDIALSDPVPLDQSSLSLELSEENILPYFREEMFMITAQGDLKQRVNNDVNLNARVKFRVKGRL